MMSRLSRTILVSLGAAVACLSHLDAALAGISINPGFGTNSASARSWVAGAHAGYMFQQGGAVFGFETDLQGMNLTSSMNGGLLYLNPFPVPALTDTARTSANIGWYGTARGLVGLANGPFLFYVTGGLAYGQVSLNSLFTTGGATLNSQVSENKVGLVGGVGASYLLTPNVIFNLQYQYVDLGSLNLAASSPSPAFLVITQRANANAQFQAVMAGISFRFAPGSTAAPWQGGYAGIHGGGAWGLNSSAAYDSTLFFPSDSRLKRDVTLLDRRGDGLGIYAYKYLWSDVVHIGVMAQEVALIHPAAVVRDELTGLMSVNYDLLNGN